MNAGTCATSRRDTGLVWSIKGSFLDYVDRWPDTSIEISPGTGRLSDGSFYFTPDPDREPNQWWFRGGVRIRAHGGLLDVSLADPRVERAGTDCILTAETWIDGRWGRIPVADLQWPSEHVRDGPVLMVIVPARLHQAATALFDGTYPTGTDLAVLQMRLVPALEHGATAPSGSASQTT